MTIRFWLRSLRCVVLLGLVYCIPATGQISDGLYNSLPDSLKPENKLSLSLGDKQRILKGAPDYYSGVYAHEYQAIAVSLNKIGVQTRNRQLKVETKFSLGVYYAFLDEKEKAIAYFKETIHDIGSSREYTSTLAWAYSNLAIQYHNKGDNENSPLAFLHNSLQVDGADRDSSLLSQNYNLYSIIYAQLNLYEKAIYYGKLAINVAPFSAKWNTNYTVLVFANGIIYEQFYEQTKKKAFADSAKGLFKQVVAIKKKEAANWYAQCYYNLGTLAYLMGQYTASKQYLDSASLPKYNHSPYMFDRNFYGIYLYKALCLIKLGQYAEGKKLLRTIQVTKLSHRKLLYQALYEQAQARHDWEIALGYYKQYKLAVDSLDIDNQKGRIFEAEQKYVAAQNRATIATLEIQNLNQIQQRNLAIAAGIIFLLLLVLVYFQYKRQQFRRAVAEQNVAAERKRREEELFMLEADMKLQQADAMLAQRRKIAEDMHDDLSSSFVTLRYYIADIKQETRSEEARTLLDSVETEVTYIHESARKYMQELNTDARVQEHDFADLLLTLTQEISEKTPVSVEVTMDREQVQLMLMADQYNQLYLIIKEAIANTLKHANATKIAIAIRFDYENCLFSILDNGTGFNVGQVSSVGLGLQSAQHRIQALNGTLTVDSDSTGTRLSGSFPIEGPLSQTLAGVGDIQPVLHGEHNQVGTALDL